MATQTREVLVTNATGGTRLDDPTFTSRRHVRIQNLGPNAIHVTTGSLVPVVGVGLLVAVDTVIEFNDLAAGDKVQAIASTAAQATGNATIVVEW